MKTIRFSLLALAVSFTALLSCTKSDLTTAASTANGTRNGAVASMDHSECGMHCTCTQAQWGTDGRGNDLIAHFFVKEFPNGFPIGSKSCENGYTIWVKDANALKMMLPMRGKPAVLTQDYTDSWPNNALVGELISLCCNMDLEHYDPMFDSHTTPLRDMKIASGTFQGWTVLEFFKTANEVVGGCNDMYKPAEVSQVAKAINENYMMVGKTMFDNGYLMCP